MNRKQSKFLNFITNELLIYLEETHVNSTKILSLKNLN